MASASEGAIHINARRADCQRIDSFCEQDGEVVHGNAALFAGGHC